MIWSTLIMACNTTGSADFTLTDLDDPSGNLSESWSAESAYWYWSNDVISLWSLSQTTGLLSDLGDVAIDALGMGTDEESCEDLQDLLDVGAALVDGVESSVAIDDHCDDLTTFFSDLADLDDDSAEARTTVSATVFGSETSSSVSSSSTGGGVTEEGRSTVAAVDFALCSAAPLAT